MHAGEPTAPHGPQDRQLSELLQELRVALPGVQLLLGFLLVVPFNQRFGAVEPWERDVYLVALLAAVTSSACLIAPAAFHRLVFHRGERARIIALATRLLLVGLAALAVSITASVLLVTSYLFPTALAVASTTFAGLIITTLWLGLGLAARRFPPE